MSTPNRPPPGATATPTPGSASSRNTVMDCTPDPSRYTTILIHTAKCALCNERNMGTMRRCPGCTFQVCQPCFDRRNGAPLRHGDMDDSPMGLPATPVRRRLFGIPAGLTATFPPTPPGQVEGSKIGAGQESGRGRSPEEGDRNAIKKAPMRDDPTEGMEAPEPTAQPKSSTAKRPRKAKKQAAVRDLSDSDEDFDFILDSPSPTPPSKRRRNNDEGEVQTPGESGKDTKVSRTRRPTRTSTNPTPDQLPIMRASGSSGKRARPVDEESEQSTNEEIQSGKDAKEPNVLDREVGDDSIQALLEYHGIDLPSNRYKEHLLHRQQPVIQNPVIKIPENVARNFKPRPSAQEIQQRIQEKVLAGLNEMRVKAKAEKSAFDKQSLDDFIKGKIAELLYGVELSEEQHTKVTAKLTSAIVELVNEYHADQAPAFRRDFKMDLQTQMEYFNTQQVEGIVKVIEEKGDRILKQLQSGADLSETPTLSKKARLSTAPVSMPSGSPTLPPIGAFQVNPSKSRRDPGLSTTPSKAFDSPGPGRATSAQTPTTKGDTTGDEEFRSFSEPHRY